MPNQASFFFYDLETSGVKTDTSRIMQFAGQRLDMDLEPVGEPLNLLIKLHEDVLPDPYAVLVHGIEPQTTLLEGLSEVEFMRAFYSEVVKPGTVFVGFNNVRFDDEFIRYINYRNLYDPYAWAYKDGCSRWDMLDVSRMFRALSPKHIIWPKDENGKNTNRLEMLASANKLSHELAHDALSDVTATIELSRLLKKSDPELFMQLFKLRAKDEVSKVINRNEPFFYTSSHYPSSLLHTTIAFKVGDNLTSKSAVLVYDLRHDPTPWLKMSSEQLADAWRYDPKRDFVKNPSLPLKTLRLNRCPAVLPLLEKYLIPAVFDRLDLDMDSIMSNLALLKNSQKEFAQNLNGALEILNREQLARNRQQKRAVDARLYDGASSLFYSDHDAKLLKELHADNQESPARVRALRARFSDPRLSQLSSFYLARNFKKELTPTERKGWDDYLKRQLLGGGESSALANYFKQIAQLKDERTEARAQVLLEDLKLYGESLIPSDFVEQA